MKPIIGIGYDLACCNQVNYIEAVEMAGGIPVLIPPVEDFDGMTKVLDRIDGLLLSGGTDVNPELYGENPKHKLGRIDPKRDVWEMKLMEHVYKKTNIPIFGICRGFQLMNVYFGGSLYQDIKTEIKDSLMHWLVDFPESYPSHEIDILEKSKIRVNSRHHQAIKVLGKELRATSFSEDKLIESFEMDSTRFILAVQYHPELMVKDYDEQLNLFRVFVNACQ